MLKIFTKLHLKAKWFYFLWTSFCKARNDKFIPQSALHVYGEKNLYFCVYRCRYSPQILWRRCDMNPVLCLNRRNLNNSYSILLVIFVIGTFLVLYQPRRLHSQKQTVKYKIDYEELEHEMRVEAQNRIHNDVTYAPVFEKHFNRFYNGTKNRDHK